MADSMNTTKPIALSTRAMVKTSCVGLMSLVALLSLMVLVRQNSVHNTFGNSEPFPKIIQWSQAKNDELNQSHVQSCNHTIEVTERALKDIFTTRELNTTEAPEEIIKLLVLAYPRTGSSFTGDILSSSANAYYLFEPLQNKGKMGPEKMGDFIENLFACEPLQGSQSKKHKNVGHCKSSNPRVIKTIRLHKINMDPWIVDSDIKVVHLVRDPRAEYNSMMRLPSTWQDPLNHIDRVCMTMANDMHLKDLLPSERYFMVRYEDLMMTPISTLVDLYTQLKLDFDVEAADALYSHTRVTSNAHKQELNKYYSTYRTGDSDIYKWKKQMSLEKIRYVEESCAQLMKIAGYEVFNPATKHN